MTTKINIQIRRFMTIFNILTSKTYIMVADGTVLLQFDNISQFYRFLYFLAKSFRLLPLGGEVANYLFALRFYLDDKRFHKRKHFYQLLDGKCRTTFTNLSLV